MSARALPLVLLTSLLPETKAEAATDSAAVAFVASPYWLPILKETSEYAAYMLPILGCSWIVIQMGIKFYSIYRLRSRRRHRR